MEGNSSDADGMYGKVDAHVVANRESATPRKTECGIKRNYGCLVLMGGAGPGESIPLDDGSAK